MRPTLTFPALTISNTSFAYQAKSSGVLINGAKVGLVTFKHFGMSLSGAKAGTAPFPPHQSTPPNLNRGGTYRGVTERHDRPQRPDDLKVLGPRVRSDRLRKREIKVE